MPAENLKRNIGLFGLTCSIVNCTIGAGIFVLPALVAENLGDASILAYLICGVLIFLIGLCYAEVGSKIKTSGGSYTYIETAFGSFWGFIINNLYWFGGAVLSVAAVANGVFQTITYLLPSINVPFARPLFLLLLFGTLAVINIRGVKNGLWVVIVLTIAKLLPLFLIIIVGIGQADLAFQWNTSFSIHDIGAATLILMFAFTGVEDAVTNGGEFKNPSRIVPLGILYGLVMILIIYILIQSIAQGVLGSQLPSFKNAPLSEVAKNLVGLAGVTLITAGTAISMLGGISGSIMALPRVLFAGGRDGILPGILAKVHPKFATPYIAIIVYASLGFLIATIGTFKQLLLLSTGSTLLMYLGVSLATIKLRYKKGLSSEKTFRAPGGVVVPLLAFITVVWLLFNLKTAEMAAIGIALIALSLIYFLTSASKKKQMFWKKQIT